jgi:hypothetical protein
MTSFLPHYFSTTAVLQHTCRYSDSTRHMNFYTKHIHTCTRIPAEPDKISKKIGIKKNMSSLPYALLQYGTDTRMVQGIRISKWQPKERPRPLHQRVSRRVLGQGWEIPGKLKNFTLLYTRVHEHGIRILGGSSNPAFFSNIYSIIYAAHANEYKPELSRDTQHMRLKACYCLTAHGPNF